MITLTSQAYSGSQKFPSLACKITDACPDARKRGTVHAQAPRAPLSSHVLSRWEPYFCTHPCFWWASPLKQAPERHPSPFIREAIGSQLSGDGPTPLKLIRMSSYHTLQAAGTDFCLWWVSHHGSFPSLAGCWVCWNSLGHGSAYAWKNDTNSGNARKQAGRGAVLLLGSHYGFPPPDAQVAFTKGREGERLPIPHCSRGRKSPDNSFLPP